jgi:hypothetical protein
VIISIRPRFEGGYNIFVSDAWVAGALSLEQARAAARARALEVAAGGQIALVATRDLGGEIESVEWFDPPRDVVTLPDVERAEAPEA